MAINTWRIMVTPQVCRRYDIASPRIHPTWMWPTIEEAGFFNTTGFDAQAVLSEHRTTFNGSGLARSPRPQAHGLSPSPQSPSSSPEGPTGSNQGIISRMSRAFTPLKHALEHGQATWHGNPAPPDANGRVANSVPFSSGWCERVGHPFA
jgi:hypothetical protein